MRTAATPGAESIPHLEWLILTNNKLSSVAVSAHALRAAAALCLFPALCLCRPPVRRLADALLTPRCPQDLEPLGSLPRLKYLSLVDNPVTKQPGYRLFLISRCKKLKVLDFRKVKQKEREDAEAAFGGRAAPAAATFEPDEEMAAAEAAAGVRPEEPSIRKGPTPEQLTAIKAAISAASTLEEVRRLEEALQTGQMPSELGATGAAAMEEG
jgi:Leucine-rich repeat (LRR) protein